MSGQEIGEALGSDCSDDVDELLGSGAGGLAAVGLEVSVIGGEQDVSAPPLRSKRRKLDEIPTRERWHCPNRGCGREYKRTSTTSIGQHKDRCSKKPVFKAEPSSRSARPLRCHFRAWEGWTARCEAGLGRRRPGPRGSAGCRQQPPACGGSGCAAGTAAARSAAPAAADPASAGAAVASRAGISARAALQQQFLLHQQQPEQQQMAAQSQFHGLSAAQSNSSLPPLTTAQLQKLNQLLLLSDYQRAASEDSGSSSSSLPPGFSPGAGSNSELISQLSRSAPASQLPPRQRHGRGVSQRAAIPPRCPLCSGASSSPPRRPACSPRRPARSCCPTCPCARPLP